MEQEKKVYFGFNHLSKSIIQNLPLKIKQISICKVDTENFNPSNSRTEQKSVVSIYILTTTFRGREVCLKRKNRISNMNFMLTFYKFKGEYIGSEK